MRMNRNFGDFFFFLGGGQEITQRHAKTTGVLLVSLYTNLKIMVVVGRHFTCLLVLV